MALRTGEALRDFQHIRTLLEKYLEEAGLESESDLSGPQVIRTGFIDLDTLLGGLKRSDLVILAARPSMGKSALGMAFARNAAVAQKAKVAVFSLEMSADQLAQRLLASEANVDSTRLRLGEHTEAEERRIMHAMGVLAGCDIFIDDTAVLSVGEMKGKVMRLQREHGLDLIVIDYLQLMQGNGGGRNENRVQEISMISRTLKMIARELNVPVVALAQLSRAVESRTPHIPMLSDLRDSGSIEQDADVVMFIYREDYYTKKEEWETQNPDRPARGFPAGIAQVIVAKHRNGPVGNVDLRFIHKTAKFEDLMVRDDEPPL
jgi:replicative DNA helicase